MSRWTACGVALLFLGLSGMDCPSGMTDGNLNTRRPFPHTTPWTPEIPINTNAGVGPTIAVVALLNADGLPDVIAAYPGGDKGGTPRIVAYFQVTPTMFQPQIIFEGAAIAGVASLAIGDISGDGLPDIVAGCNGQITFLIQPTDRTFTGPWSGGVIGQSDDRAFGLWTDVAIVQVDRLAGLDVVACNASPGQLSWFQSPTNPLVGGAWRRFDIDNVARADASALLATDVNSDGNPDVICAARGEPDASIAWYLHPGQGVFDGSHGWEKRPIGALNDAARIDIGDLDGDGRMDVVAISPHDLRVAWYTGPPDVLTVEPWAGFVLADFAEAAPSNVKVVDVDRNGPLDVIVSTSDPGALRWLTPVNDRKLRWVENNLIDLNENVTLFAVADINRDARMDVVAPLSLDGTHDRISWFLNPEP